MIRGIETETEYIPTILRSPNIIGGTLNKNYGIVRNKQMF